MPLPLLGALASVLGWMSSLGSGIISAVLTMGMLFGAVFAGFKVADQTKRNWAGWIAGIVAFFVLGLVFYPSVETLREKSCQDSDDYTLCMEGE